VLEVELDLDPDGQVGWLWVDGHPLAVVRSRGRWGRPNRTLGLSNRHAAGATAGPFYAVLKPILT